MTVNPVQLIPAALCRSREFLADGAGLRISRSPLALGSPLRKIESWGQEVPMRASSAATAHLLLIREVLSSPGALVQGLGPDRERER